MEAFLLPLTGEEQDSEKNMRKKNASVVLNQPCFFPTALSNTTMQTESGTLVLKQSIINYKTLLQTDGPSPVRCVNA